MAKFLTAQEGFRIIQRELPSGVYPDGSPSAYFSTADSFATAKTLETMYANLKLIEDNTFPQSAVDRISDWENFVFGYQLSSALALQTRRDLVLAKIRKQPSIALWEILTLLAQYVPEGTYVQVSATCQGVTTWQLGYSFLGYDTYLKGITFDALGINSEDWCSVVSNLHWRLGQDQLGVTTELSEFLYTDIASIQSDAYLYDIRIFGYTISGPELEQLEAELSAAEPARSSHRLTQGLALIDFGLINTVANVDKFSLVNCVTRDVLSTTGYTGLTT